MWEWQDYLGIVTAFLSGAFVVDHRDKISEWRCYLMFVVGILVEAMMRRNGIFK